MVIITQDKIHILCYKWKKIVYVIKRTKKYKTNKIESILRNSTVYIYTIYFVCSSHAAKHCQEKNVLKIMTVYV